MDPHNPFDFHPIDRTRQFPMSSIARGNRMQFIRRQRTRFAVVRWC